MTTVPISDDSIRLGQFLKLADLADSGAHARELLDDGAVTVNGEDEARRGRQLVRGRRRRGGPADRLQGGHGRLTGARLHASR